ncbi:hypothetical protein Fmac_031013 [Flemingia macrophylla]|uniref:WIYLD domain-containing protein n=1 Tax=Flemingia macrophylla TaxID=520843 RepID=A0ABD1L0W2_9FABA
MASTSRSRHHRKGNTRIDAALDAMHQLGFEKKLVRETVKELLDAYDGTQGWPFIEEASYRLLIETILTKQEDSAEDKVGARRDGFNETILHAGGDLDSSSQANDQNYASLGNLETDVRDSDVLADRGEHEQDMVMHENLLKPADNVKENNDCKCHVESTYDKTPDPTIQSSKAFDHLPCSRRKNYFGWIEDDGDDDEELIQFPVPALSKQIEKMIGQCELPQNRRKGSRISRWDVKPDGME